MSAETSPVPVSRAPGLYPDVPELEYHADDAVSQSGLKALLDCPARYRWQLDHPSPPRDVYDFGHAAHAKVLGTGLDVVEVTADSWQTKAAREAKAEAHAAGKVPLLTKDVRMVDAMAEAVLAHPAARVILEAKGPSEVSAWWVDPETDVPCRARFDRLTALADGTPVIVDLKGLALDTPIPTPEGWATMRSLAVGDHVFDSTGTTCTVTQKSSIHYNPCYRIRFDDGSDVICDAEHRWVTTTGSRADHTAVRTTEEVRQTLRGATGQRDHRVSVSGPLDLPPVALPVAPYVLGAWLGDGDALSGRISKPDDELFSLIASCGYEIGQPPPSSVARGCQTRTIYGLVTQLKQLGLVNNKRVPAVYLRASEPQRLALLQGLMDTDGCWNTTRNQAVFTSTDKNLALSLRELALTLGQRATLHPYTAKGFGRTVQAYTVTFTPIGGMRPFLLKRKADKAEAGATRGSVSKRRVIVEVNAVPIIATQCITVDSPDSTYLCGEAFIPTHNTTVSAAPARFGKSVWDYGYHAQRAMYVAGHEVLTGQAAEFVIIAVEKDAPHLPAVYTLDPLAIERGQWAIRDALDLYVACTTTDTWPGYAADVTTLPSPRWAS